MNKIPYKIYLEESEMPRKWYNLRADMKNKPAPLLNPATMQPMTKASNAEISGTRMFTNLFFIVPPPHLPAIARLISSMGGFLPE